MHQSSISIKKHTRKTDWVRGWRWLEAKIMRLKQSLSQSGRPMLRSLTLTTKWRKSDFHLLNVPFGHHGRLSLRSTVCIYSLMTLTNTSALHNIKRQGILTFIQRDIWWKKMNRSFFNPQVYRFYFNRQMSEHVFNANSKFKCRSLNLRVFT